MDYQPDYPQSDNADIDIPEAENPEAEARQTRLLYLLMGLLATGAAAWAVWHHAQ
jgi:hypothetical protein